jgi:hypothetical protein
MASVAYISRSGLARRLYDRLGFTAIRRRGAFQRGA